MLKTIIKIAIALVILNGAWRVGSSFWTYYRFEDGLQEIAQFGYDKDIRALHKQAVALSRELEVPVTPEEITVRKTDRQVFIEASYTDQLQVFPQYYYPWEFKISTKAWIRP